MLERDICHMTKLTLLAASTNSRKVSDEVFFFLDISVISVTYAINYIIKHRCLACGQCKNATW